MHLRLALSCRFGAIPVAMNRPGQSLTFDTDPERVVLQAADGQAIDSPATFSELPQPPVAPDGRPFDPGHPCST